MFAYNDLYAQIVNRILRPFLPVLNFAVENFLGRLLMFKAYLHSDVSSHISVRLEKGDRGNLVLKGCPNSETGKIVKMVKSKMFANKGYLKGVPIPILNIGIPGAGNHSGASMPMKKKPSGFESDLWGRPVGFKRFHDGFWIVVRRNRFRAAEYHLQLHIGFDPVD